MLVAGYGPQRGYYAVDVTNPTRRDGSGLPTDPPTAGPRGPGVPVAAHQDAGERRPNYPLFGAHSATPAITTLYMDPGDGGGAREIGVAILPGGQTATPPRRPATARRARARSRSHRLGPRRLTYRPAVRCWGGTPSSTDPAYGRSVTIVRLDTGEILRVFVRPQRLRRSTRTTRCSGTASPTRRSTRR